MYFPYIRGRQFDLLALRDLVEKNLLHEHIVPVIEPVSLSSTLVSTITQFNTKKHPLAIIQNPEVGSFSEEFGNFDGAIGNASRKLDFKAAMLQPAVLQALIMNNEAPGVLSDIVALGIQKQDILVVLNDRDMLKQYQNLFASDAPRYTIIPDEGTFRRNITENKVVLTDSFQRQERNADYNRREDESFSDIHLYYRDEGYVGFADYSIIGDSYNEAGFAPYAVAIHIVYPAIDKSLRVRHFVSDSNQDINNPAHKFYQALKKMVQWYEKNERVVPLTLGLKILLDHYQAQTYPGLGSLKKLTIMHHLELMGKLLDGGLFV